MVAYSGGVDSAFLAATAHRVLGDRMLAVLADSPSLARRDMEQARAFADAQGIPLRVIQTEELDKPEYQRNDANRCFHCKTELFEGMKKLGAELGFAQIAYGMNADDRRDYRPGQRAAEEHEVLAPLAEVGLDQTGDSNAGQRCRLHAVGSPGRTMPFVPRGIWPHGNARSAGAGGARRREPPPTGIPRVSCPPPRRTGPR